MTFKFEIYAVNLLKILEIYFLLFKIENYQTWIILAKYRRPLVFVNSKSAFYFALATVIYEILINIFY